MEEEEWRSVHQRHQPPRRREVEQDGIGKIKVKIPSFEGRCDPEVYLEWETKIEQIWNCVAQESCRQHKLPIARHNTKYRHREVDL